MEKAIYFKSAFSTVKSVEDSLLLKCLGVACVSQFLNLGP